MIVVTVTTGACLDVNGEVDQLVRGGVNRLRASRLSAGGKGINVARVCNALGVPAKAIVVVGGHIGHVIQHQLESEALDYESIEAAGESRINVKVREDSGRETAINATGVVMGHDCEEGLVGAVGRLCNQASALAIAGSLARGASTDLYSRCIALARSRGVLTALDTSGDALEQSLSAAPDIVKPNQEEAQALLGCELASLDDAVAAARRIATLGAKTVLLTLGSHGAVAFSSEHGVYVCRPPDVVALHTVGCGDSFLAAFLAGTLKGLSFSMCLRLASAAGAAAAISPRVAGVDQSVVDSLLEQTVVKQIS
jgi:1-phosphofructokinase family hexose kinase